jgi:hypothetical protein
MIRNEESIARVELASRVLIQFRYRTGQPLLQSEIAQLHFLAEADDELKLPLDRLALAIIDRERKRMRIPPQWDIGFTGRN